MWCSDKDCWWMVSGCGSMVEVKLNITEETCNWLWYYMMMANADGHPEAGIIMEQLPLPTNMGEKLAKEFEIAEKLKEFIKEKSKDGSH